MNKYTLHLCSLNCQGLGNKNKRERLFQWVNYQKCNILFAQETHFEEKIIREINNEFTGNVYSSFGNTQSRGVSIFIKNNVEFKFIDLHKDEEGRVLILNLEIDKDIYTLVNLYAPNFEKIEIIFSKK